MLTASLVSHRQGDIAQRVLDDLAVMDRRLTKVIVTRNVAEAWEPRLAHPSAALVVIDNPRPKGFGANHNAAFARCRDPFFAVLNPDLRFGGADLCALLPRFDDAGLALLAPTIVGPDGAAADFARDLMTLPNLVRRHLGAPPGPAAWLAGMCLVIRSAAFRAVGGFDERYFLYCEDADLCGRLVLEGWRIGAEPTLRVVHDARRRSLRSAGHLAHHVASLLRYWASGAFWRYRARLATGAAPPVAGAPGPG